MKPYCLVTTYYCYGSNVRPPAHEHIKAKLRYDGLLEDLYINFDNSFDPWHMDHLNIGMSRRKDLIYGKIFLLKTFIEKHILNQYKFICHIDYSDTKFVKSFIDMMRHFEKSNKKFIIATEKNYWPPIDNIKKSIPYKLEDKEFIYINSGAIIAETNIFYSYLTKLINLSLNINIDFWDDQGVWQYYHLTEDTLISDNICEYFFCTSSLDSSYYSIDLNGIKTKFNTYPYLIHDNGSFNLDLINKV